MKTTLLHTSATKAWLIREVLAHGGAKVLANFAGTDDEAIEIIAAHPTKLVPLSAECNDRGPDGACRGHRSDRALPGQVRPGDEVLVRGVWWRARAARLRVDPRRAGGGRRGSAARARGGCEGSEAGDVTAPHPHVLRLKLCRAEGCTKPPSRGAGRSPTASAVPSTRASASG